MTRTLRYTSFAVINESKQGELVECQVCAQASSFPHHRVQFFNQNEGEAYYRWLCNGCLIELRKTGKENV